jgi:hypothetical protein
MNHGHNSPYDRGGADSWYMRPPEPHKKDETGKRVTNLTPEEIIEYYKGYEANELANLHKDYN